MGEKLLIVDDDPTILKVLTNRFETRGYKVLSASNPAEALRAAYEGHPDLVILDIMMPEMDGYETCRRLRALSDVPILMLTAKTDSDDLVRGFEAGADDYVKKPFDFQELEMRIRAILKRARALRKGNALYDDGSLRADLERGLVYRCGQLVHLTPTEFRLLSYLIRNGGRVVSHAELLREVWGEAYLDATASLSLYIRYLREKLEDDPAEPRYLRNQWGTGYWFSPAEPAYPLEALNLLPVASMLEANAF
jgi:two-component system KDP operon response regulator KdpE